jgi:acetyl-CoA carboxylase biotin carboxyl carrier protein
MSTKATPKTPYLNLEQLNVADLRKLADFLNESGLEEIEIELGEARLRLKRPSLTAAAVPVAQPIMAQPTPTIPQPTSSGEDTSTAANSFKSPMVGTFYRAGGPDTPAFVKEGDVVKEGQTLCIIEAMKTMNQIESDRAGKITKVLIDNEKPVEFGQPLFIIT